jgi:hypothetical protein
MKQARLQRWWFPHLRDSLRGRSQLPVRHSGGRRWLLKQVRAARHSSDAVASAKRLTVF